MTSWVWGRGVGRARLRGGGELGDGDADYAVHVPDAQPRKRARHHRIPVAERLLGACACCQPSHSMQLGSPQPAATSVMDPRTRQLLAGCQCCSTSSTPVNVCRAAHIWAERLVLRGLHVTNISNWSANAAMDVEF